MKPRSRFAILALAVVATFASTWEASSRAWLPRIRQPDDLTLTISNAKAWEPDRVLDPLGDLSPVCSCTFCPSPIRRDGTACVGTRFNCDGFTSDGRMLYTYGARSGMWTVWTPLELRYMGAK